jgi:hypothetical protein
MNATTLRRLERLETEVNDSMVVIKCQPGETPEAAVARHEAANPNERAGLQVVIRSFAKPEAK